MAAPSVAGKHAIVTGAGSGINFSFATLLLSKGCSVVIADLALRPEAQALLTQYPHPPTESGKPSAIFQKTDVTSWPALSALFDKCLSTYGAVDIVVCGAGLFEPRWSHFWHPPRSETNPVTDSRDDAKGDPGHYATLDVNLLHPIRLSQLAISHWSSKKLPGTLVHVSSMAGYTASIGTPLYYASKHGMNGFVRSLASLRDEIGIRVGAVCPGAVRTPMWFEDPDKARMSGGGKDVPIEPEEIADGMLELCENPEFGDGTVLEVTKGRRRVVPLYDNPPPSGEGSGVPGYYEAEEEIRQKLKKDGIKV